MNENEDRYNEWLLSRSKGGSHYYGDSIRKHMVVAGVLLLILMPLDRELLTFYLSFGVALVLFSIISAGLTNPESTLSIVVDLVISLTVFCVFEYLAIAGYVKSETFWDTVFLLRQAIAIVTLGSLYLATKTLRGMHYRSKSKRE